MYLKLSSKHVLKPFNYNFCCLRKHAIPIVFIIENSVTFVGYFSLILIFYSIEGRSLIFISMKSSKLNQIVFFLLKNSQLKCLPYNIKSIKKIKKFQKERSHKPCWSGAPILESHIISC